MLFIESILIQLFLSVLPYEIQMLMNVFLILLVYVVNWRVFLKAGEKGWKSLIPFYNEYVQYKFLKMKDLYRVVLILQFCIVPVSIMFANIKNIFSAINGQSKRIGHFQSAIPSSFSLAMSRSIRAMRLKGVIR